MGCVTHHVCVGRVHLWLVGLGSGHVYDRPGMCLCVGGWGHRVGDSSDVETVSEDENERGATE